MAGSRAWRVGGLLKSAAGGLSAGAAAYGGFRYLQGKYALCHALWRCEEEVCTDRYRAIPVVRVRKFWFDTTDYYCPSGGDLIDQYHATRRPD